MSLYGARFAGWHEKAPHTVPRLLAEVATVPAEAARCRRLAVAAPAMVAAVVVAAPAATVALAEAAAVWAGVERSPVRAMDSHYVLLAPACAEGRLTTSNSCDHPAPCLRETAAGRRALTATPRQTRPNSMGRGGRSSMPLASSWTPSKTSKGDTRDACARAHVRLRTCAGARALGRARDPRQARRGKECFEGRQYNAERSTPSAITMRVLSCPSANGQCPVSSTSSMSRFTPAFMTYRTR